MDGSAKDEPVAVSNKAVWDKVLVKEGKDSDPKNGDLLYEYPRKVLFALDASARWVRLTLHRILIQTYFAMLSAGSLGHIAFWSWFKGYEQSLVEMLPQLGEPTMFSWITNDLGSTLGFGSSILMAFLIGFHARRAVARISIVSGGDKLRITTHKFFGDLGTPQDIPVNHISANPNTKNNIILKIGNQRAFYLVDVRGQFYNRAKLESMLTFRTDFSDHAKMKDTSKKAPLRTDLPKTDLKPADLLGNSALPKRTNLTAKGQKGKAPNVRRTRSKKK
ncbi:TPA: hypothetical protein N0F65_003269 [Lagenidium giganteum]|uniref:Photosystem I assembly protein Ycf4 n=1 Tax=Lagenidium giganteum TaxID=4803 RepID=A0AAV2YHH0_9STRA|nr:TPA: hypothetical protein N0F65_003269 [Lagenidium giganteum]